MLASKSHVPHGPTVSGQWKYCQLVDDVRSVLRLFPCTCLDVHWFRGTGASCLPLHGSGTDFLYLRGVNASCSCSGDRGTYWPWEPTATLRSAGAVGSAARGASAPTEGGEGRGHIVAAVMGLAYSLFPLSLCLRVLFTLHRWSFAVRVWRLIILIILYIYLLTSSADSWQSDNDIISLLHRPPSNVLV